MIFLESVERGIEPRRMFQTMRAAAKAAAPANFT
jgi:hypothetical protein